MDNRPVAIYLNRMFSSFEMMVAGRYLRARKAEGFVSVIAAFSFLGIMLGVATLIIVMSVMNGFKSEMLGNILGLNGHISVYAEGGPLPDYKNLAAKLQTVDGVTAAFPIVESQALMSVQGSAVGVMVRGISREDFARKPILSTSIKSGTLDLFQGDTVAVGTVLANRFHLKTGDQITLIAPKGHTSPFGTIPRSASYTIAIIFDVGVYQYNNGFIFMPLDTAQAFYPGAERGDVHRDHDQGSAAPRRHPAGDQYGGRRAGGAERLARDERRFLHRA